MKYSVIIPVYNVEDKLQRCLDSLLNQRFNDCEIILVNDGSKDSSAAICRRYANEYTNIVFIDQENGGASSARNTGIDAAKGDYILFVDSDDYVSSDYFATLQGKGTKDGLSVFTYTLKTEKGEHIRDISGCLNAGDTLFCKAEELIVSRTINSPYAKIFDRALLNAMNLRFDVKMPVAEDFNFCLAYLMASKEVNIYQDSVYVYDNTNQNSLVKKRKKGLIDIYPYVFNTAMNTVRSSAFQKNEKETLYCIIDKLHTDSFITCVMEEQKDVTLSAKEVKSEIRNMCRKFYQEFRQTYGYYNLVHYSVRTCIKYKLVNTLYYLCLMYRKMRD